MRALRLPSREAAEQISTPTRLSRFWEALTLVVLRGLSYEQVAWIWRCKVGTVKSRAR